MYNVFMDVLSRKKFKDVMCSVLHTKKITSKHGLWTPEHMRTKKIKCVHFVYTNYIDTFSRKLFWEWCDDTLKGDVRCFSSGDEGEWWGFTEQDDIVIWTLKWVK